MGSCSRWVVKDERVFTENRLRLVRRRFVRAASVTHAAVSDSTRVPVITVDGPGGVGKGTVARRISQRLGWNRLDSGALYRLAAVAAQDHDVSPDDAEGVARLCLELDVEFREDATGQEQVLLAGDDVTTRLRLESTGEAASRLSAWPVVRTALLDRQRAFRRTPGLVADGRDMGSVVFPDAILKLFLDAEVAARAERRRHQLSGAGINVKLDKICAQIAARDARDRNRRVSPLRPASDAVTIDTTQMSVADVEAHVGALLMARGIA